MKVIGHLQPVIHYNPDHEHLVPFGYEILARGRLGQRTFMPTDLAQLYDWAEIDHAVLKYISECRCRLCTLQGNERKLFVNLSPRTLMHPKSFSQWIELLKQIVEVGPERIIIEINEMTNPEQLIPNLDAFRDLGMSLALDDFGCGHDRSAQLIAAQWDYCKFDVQAYSGHRDDMARDIETCHSMGIRVIVEKIETLADMPIYTAMGVDLFQGYALGKPTAPGDIHDPAFQKDDGLSSEIPFSAAV